MRTKAKRKHRKQQHQDGPSNTASAVYDLMIPLPKESASIRIQDILQRLRASGFTHSALTHTVFGTPKPNADEADKAIPERLWQGGKGSGKKKASSGSAEPKDSQSLQVPPVKVLRRLNAVVESLLDLSHYTKRDNVTNDSPPSMVSSDAVSKSLAIVQGYDLVSLCPRNDIVFQSACKSATSSDIIVLDYTSGRGGVQLPFKIRSVDVKAAIARNAVFEIPYAAAILNRNQRKGLIQTCRALQLASLGAKPRVILSSGRRSVVEGEDDVGTMALRTPTDLMNLMQVVMKFDARLSYEALHTANTFALDQAHIRRFGKQSITISGIAVMGEGVEEGKEQCFSSKQPPPAAKKSKLEEAVEKTQSDDDNVNSEGDEDAMDGFIAF